MRCQRPVPKRNDPTGATSPCIAQCGATLPALLAGGLGLPRLLPRTIANARRTAVSAGVSPPLVSPVNLPGVVP